MELRDITMDDLPLYEGTLTDPGMMSELGGPLPRAGLAEKLQGIVNDVLAGRVWYFTIIPGQELQDRRERLRVRGPAAAVQHLED